MSFAPENINNESNIPVAPRHRKPRKRETIKYLSEEQIDRFFDVIDDPRDLAMFRVIYHRGLRASEVRLLQLSDWNQQRDRLRVSRIQASNSGEYRLTSREARALRAWLGVRGTEPGPLFRSGKKGKGIGQQRLDQLMKRYGRLASLPRELCHVQLLKHSRAVHLLNRGESMETVQDHLGYATIKSTAVYAKKSIKRRAAKDQRLRGE